MFKVNKTTPKRRQACRSGFFIDKFLTDFTHWFGISIVDFEQVNTDWVADSYQGTVVISEQCLLYKLKFSSKITHYLIGKVKVDAKCFISEAVAQSCSVKKVF